MSDASPTRDAFMENEEESIGEEQVLEQGSHRLDLPADGYEWRKYGQKFIKNIGKFRSYFRCHKQNCTAKKRAEWSGAEPNNLRIVYEGVHTHPSSEAASSGNRYNLYTQVFGLQQADNAQSHRNQDG